MKNMKTHWILYLALIVLIVSFISSCTPECGTEKPCGTGYECIFGKCIEVPVKEPDIIGIDVECQDGTCEEWEIPQVPEQCQDTTVYAGEARVFRKTPDGLVLFDTLQAEGSITFAGKVGPVDNNPPEVHHIFPEGGAIKPSGDIYFIYGVYDDEDDSLECMFEIDDQVIEEWTEVEEGQNYFVTHVSNPGSHYWEIICREIEDTGKVGWDQDGPSYFSIDTSIVDINPPVVELVEPTDGSAKPLAPVNFVYTVEDDYDPLCRLYLDDTLTSSDWDVVADGLNFFRHIEVGVGIHSWNVECMDLSGNSANSTNGPFELLIDSSIVDTESPVTNLVEPKNDSVRPPGDHGLVFSVSDNYDPDCQLWIDDVLVRDYDQLPATTVFSNEVEVYFAARDDPYKWNVKCKDMSDNEAWSENGPFILHIRAGQNLCEEDEVWCPPLSQCVSTPDECNLPPDYCTGDCAIDDTCLCDSCDGQQDHCKLGLICDYETNRCIAPRCGYGQVWCPPYGPCMDDPADCPYECVGDCAIDDTCLCDSCDGQNDHCAEGLICGEYIIIAQEGEEKYCTVTGDNYEFPLLPLDKDLSEVKDMPIDSGDLQFLSDEEFIDDEGEYVNDVVYTQELKFESGNAKFGEDEDDIKSLIIFEDIPLYDYILRFNNPVYFDITKADEDFFLAKLIMLGRSGYITDVHVSSAGYFDELNLMLGKGEVWLQQDQPYVVGDKIIMVVDVDDAGTVCGVDVDGVTHWIDKGKVEYYGKFAIGVIDAIPVNVPELNEDKCKLLVEANEIKLEEGNEVEIDGASVEGSLVSFNTGISNSEGSLLGFHVYYQSDYDDYFVHEGDDWLDPVFGIWKLMFVEVLDETNAHIFLAEINAQVTCPISGISGGVCVCNDVPDSVCPTDDVCGDVDPDCEDGCEEDEVWCPPLGVCVDSPEDCTLPPDYCTGDCAIDDTCLCQGCHGEQDHCEEGLVCDWNTRECKKKGGTCPAGTTLCNDDTCSSDCCTTDNCPAGCLDDTPNGDCEPGEGCACSDCAGEQDSCQDGAFCDYVEEDPDSSLCVGQCESGEALCNDNTCSADCCTTDSCVKECIGNADGFCAVGEGCACPDCENKQDSCGLGAFCLYDEADSDKSLCHGQCGPGTALCCDGTCSSDCIGTDTCFQGCLEDTPNGDCEPGEGCACSDCYGKQDSCLRGLICDQSSELCTEVECPVGTALCNDGTCSSDCCITDNCYAGCIAYGTDGCDEGEGCACDDCDGERDSCTSGAVCDYNNIECVREGGGTVTSGVGPGTGSSKKCDKDGDQYLNTRIGCGGSDCDDEEYSVNPGVKEKCNNVDDDCDGSVDEGCDDDDDDYCDDNMMYSPLTGSLACLAKGDCDDEDSDINPNAEELCDGIDNDCDGVIDDNCDGTGPNQDYDVSIDVKATSSPRILDIFSMNLEVENNLDNDVTNLKIKLELPSEWRVDKNPTIQLLGPHEKKTISVDVLIPDYDEETAQIKVSAVSGTKVLSEGTVELGVEIPDFMLVPEPEFDDDYSMSYGLYQVDFYYVINNKGKPALENLDLEFNLNKEGMFGIKTTPDAEIVQNFEVQAGDIVVQKLPSGPYDVEPDVQYDVVGYLYQSEGLFKQPKTLHYYTEILKI